MAKKNIDNLMVALVATTATLLVVSFSKQAKADLVLEPYVGISKLEASSEQDFGTSTSKNQLINDGFHLGARAGFTFMKNYSLFGEYFQGGPYSEVDIISGSSTNESKTTNRMYGAGVGASFDVVAISVSYMISNVVDSDTTTTDLEGSAVRVGLSLPVSKKDFLRANLDVFFHLLDEIENNPDIDFSMQTAAVSLSFPFDF